MRPALVIVIICCLLAPLHVHSVGHKQRQQQNQQQLQQKKPALDCHATDLTDSGCKSKGGHKQRAARNQAAGSSSEPAQSTLDLPLARELIHDWATGQISSLQVQRYALAAEQQVRLIH